METLGGNKQF